MASSATRTDFPVPLTTILSVLSSGFGILILAPS